MLNKDALRDAATAVHLAADDADAFDLAHAAVRAYLEALPAPEAVAVRYGWDGHGFQYLDSGSGSDFLTRHPDGEPLCLVSEMTAETTALITSQAAEIERLREALEAIIARSHNDPLGTSKVNDMRRIAEDAARHIREGGHG